MNEFAQYNDNGRGRQSDLVLAVNEYAYVLNKSTGQIKSYVGPIVVTISQQEALVIFDAKSKRFVETSDYNRAKQLFTSAPEGWYVVLKNPADVYPEAGKANSTPSSMKIGVKVNVAGPTSFALFPGQMAKVIRGHKLRTNQYLLARVYDADAAMKSRATILDAEGNAMDTKKETYFTGQLLVIKGTEVSFYMPPTGIEVLPCEDNPFEFVREAVTLERLEYCILKDESGDKVYAHGPSVVFPKPTQTFVQTPQKGVIFRALELSPISGIYVKVIAEYEENGKKHPIGEELFITGNDQMIYYPRPEHAMIQYDGKYMHHAIAIPEGEGRYILDRIKGTVKTVKGPAMYLPDPRTEVVVKRVLSAKECETFYPGNREALEYNLGLSEAQAEKQARNGKTNKTDVINNAYSTSNQEATLAIFAANGNISRGVSYTKPRTIVLDTKYEGVVAINVWTGYAVNVVSKSGKRETIIGPATRLLDYDETLEIVNLSTGKPKTTDQLISTAYLRIDNNKVSDIVTVQTKDFVDVQLLVSYNVNFLPEHKTKWFAVDNYVKHLCDRERSLLKREAKKYNIEEFYANAADIVRNIALDKNENKDNTGDSIRPAGRYFAENGMLVTDVEVLGVKVEAQVAKMMERHQAEMIQKTLDLSDATKKAEMVQKLAEFEREEAELAHKNKMYILELNQKATEEKLKNDAATAAMKRAEESATTQAKADMQKILDAIHSAQLARDRAADDEKIATEKQLAAIEEAKQKAYAETVAKMFAAISPDLVAAMESSANAQIMSGLGQAIAPYALAKGESAAEAINTLLRGTSLEKTLKNVAEVIDD
jgi:major vault protein